MNTCEHCQKETSNKKFCSRSCANTYTNKKYPKRKPNLKYCNCGKVTKRRSKFCQDCSPFVDWSSITLDNVKSKRKYQKASRIRDLARKQFLENNSTVCQNCSYDKHIEVCHIKAIHSYDATAKVAEINNPNNLIGLCPNCHWELDNGLLTPKRP